MSIWDKTVPYERRRLAIMWSGGMDSTIAWFYAVRELGYAPEDIFMIYVDYGQPYSRKETKAVKRFEKSFEPQGTKVLKFRFNLLRNELGNVPTPEKQIIPGRNLFLAWVGAFFADEVWLMALDGEMHKYMPDKNEEFFAEASKILSRVFDRRIVVRTPFADKSKADLVRWAMLHLEYPERVIEGTATCYHPTYWACGMCSTCFKKFVAMVAGGYGVERSVKHFAMPPPLSDAGEELIRKYIEAVRKRDFSHYSRKRIRETCVAIKEYVLWAKGQAKKRDFYPDAFSWYVRPYMLDFLDVCRELE